MGNHGPSHDGGPSGRRSRTWELDEREIQSIASSRTSRVLPGDGQGYSPVVRPSSGIRLGAGEDVPSTLAEEGLLLVLEGIIAQCAWAMPGRRRITGLLVEGDLSCGPRSFGPDGEWFAALTPCRVGILPWDEADRLIHAPPSAGPALWHVAGRWSSIHREWLRNDARPAEARLAHRVCEVMTRAGIILGYPIGVALPCLRQAAWADMTAMTSVHVSRCLRRMADAGLIRLKRGAITVIDPAKLMELVGFDASYLGHPGAVPGWMHGFTLDVP